MHLVVDLPSIDRAQDEGRLTAHRIFFGLPPAVTQLAAATRATATVTELAYIPESVADGPYLLELQVPALGGDAVPSRPLLYRLTEGRTHERAARGGTRARCRRPAGALPGALRAAARCRRRRRSRTCAATPSACCRSPRASCVSEELDDWARLGVEGHEHARRPWIPYHENLTAGLAALTGAHPHEVVAMNSLTVNLHLMLASFYRPQGRAHAASSSRRAPSPPTGTRSPRRSPGTGSSRRASSSSWRRAAARRCCASRIIEACLAQHGEQIALVLWPGVQFRTGQAFDLARIARPAHARGCVLGFDLAHSIGNVPLALHDSDADFAVWCSYKYLNGGPGAIGGCFVHERHADAQPRDRHAGALPGAAGRLVEPRGADALSAWSRSSAPPPARPPGRSATRRCCRPRRSSPRCASSSRPASGRCAPSRWRSPTTSNRSSAALEPQVQIITPRLSAERGCQLSIRITAGAARGPQRVRGARRARRGRATGASPDIIRVAPVPLYNRFEDVVRGSRRRCASALAASGVSGAQTPASTSSAPGSPARCWRVLLARRGLRVALYERRPDPRQSQPERGRSINLALAARGMRALERAGVMERVQPLLIAMRGRMVHEPSGHAALQPYGQRAARGHLLGRPRRPQPRAHRGGGAPRRRQRALQPHLPRRRPAARPAALPRPGERRASATRPLTPTIATDGAGSARARQPRRARRRRRPARSGWITTTRSSPCRRGDGRRASSATRCTSGRAAASC